MSRKELNALGSQRESLSKNPLLIQSEVGRVRRRCITLPNANFTYGVETIKKDGGVAQAVQSWKFHTPTLVYIAPPGKDFVALNRESVQSGLTTAEEQQHYRATHDIRRRQYNREKKEAFKLPEDMVFGAPTRPSTPIFSVLENRFQEDWITGKREEERRTREIIMRKKLRGKVYETRASLLRRYSEPVEPPPYWKMNRWADIPPKLDTFPSDKAKSEAFHYHASDGISRTGVFGHGIYQAAKS